MKIQIARPLAIGGVHHDVGTVLDVTDAEGVQLIAICKAIAVDEKTSNRAVGLEKSDAAPVSKRKRK